MLQLRPYQEETLSALRQGFLDGHRCQILYAPTGAGKTEMAIALLAATKEKGNRAAMILDRIILCEQTSQRLARYQIDHGVLQSGHWRYLPAEPIQICSAQTLERRGSLHGLNLLIIDEAHQTRKQTAQFIRDNPNIKVIGLTATPFTEGLGNIYENVVSTVTTQQLVEDQVLVPLRVFIAKEIDMTGAKKIGGEWSAQEAEKRGMQITGDIVQEWVHHTMSIFKEPVKTIVFCSGVEHGADLARNFAKAGYNFVAISYRDDDQYKRDVIAEFAKKDTNIHGLIATDILTKGFDVPDVKIGISARPFSKSLSSHIQQMGRIMRSAPGKEFAVWLDHAGNYLRFRDDWDDVFAAGVSELDGGVEKTHKEPTEKEKEDSKCPKCHALWVRGSDTCLNCGHVMEKRNQVVHVEGEMEELDGAFAMANKQEWWSMLNWYINHNGWSRGRAAHTYREKFGVWPRQLHDVEQLPSAEVHQFIEKKRRAYMLKIRRGFK